MNEVDELLLEHFDAPLEHSGVKGMKWGVRRKQNKEARIQRLKSGKGTLKDKLIRDLDIGGTNTAINGRSSTKDRIAMGIAGGVLLAIGIVQVRSVLKDHGRVKASSLRHTQQLMELDQITNFMGARMFGPLPGRGG